MMDTGRRDLASRLRAGSGSADRKQATPQQQGDTHASFMNSISRSGSTRRGNSSKKANASFTAISWSVELSASVATCAIPNAANTHP
jgi:hypothetical protein